MAGRPWALALVLLATVTLTLGASVAEGKTCTIRSPYGDVEYECAAQAAESTDDAPWWANETAQAIVGIVGVTGSAGAGAYAFYRMRTRRRVLTDLVRSVETVYTTSKAEPREGVAKLVELRSHIRARHARGAIEDAQFLELDRRVTGYLARLRRLDLDERFGGLPPGLQRDLQDRVGDGLVSVADVAYFERHPGLVSVSASLRRELLDLLREWAMEDGEAALPAAAPS